MTDFEETGKDFDLDVAMAHVGGEVELLAELAELFLKDYPRLLKEMKDAISQVDPSVLERAAHTLKGRLAFFGVHRMGEQALGLEMMGRNHNFSLAVRALNQIEAGMESVLPEFVSLTHKQKT